MKFLTKNVKIALTVLMGLALLYWGINYLKGVNLFTPANYDRKGEQDDSHAANPLHHRAPEEDTAWD